MAPSYISNFSFQLEAVQILLTVCRSRVKLWLPPKLWNSINLTVKSASCCESIYIYIKKVWVWIPCHIWNNMTTRHVYSWFCKHFIREMLFKAQESMWHKQFWSFTRKLQTAFFKDCVTVHGAEKQACSLQSDFSISGFQDAHIPRRQ